ncbi:hypothetical protein SAMN04488109_4929 [Chryseolinea serpens]|uniref:DUF763 domain-containing protein n=1 Tax=Chryseolinea serpens TaxID=947013 RepID=A0A1M5UUK8_9BACT|nr:DUF763 domain-containing protein [Chryseolinea serpens]SHH66692.1 hypothetical protein SAMN04488109_4929 [Chryseolinea serpens]
MPKLHFNNVRSADLPLHYGQVPPWLAQRMSLLGGAIVESIVLEYGKGAVLSRLSDPFWFQAFGCVLGMDWHSSGITTSVMGALKRAVNPKFKDLGIYICGGKGRHSRQTPLELMQLSDKTGLDGDALVRSSKLTAKVDNTAIQDGFQLYLHTFVVSDTGEWTVVQQGMNDANGMARRYHWHSEQVKSFVETPHTFIYGKNQGEILNMTDVDAARAKTSMLEIVKEKPSVMLPEIQRMVMPSHHDVRAKDVNLKRLGSVLNLAQDRSLLDFESLLLLEGVGPRTIQSLALVSEVIYGAPSRFTDPARFSFAHGGKDGHPFPVPTKVYDETINILKTSVEKAKIGDADKQAAIKSLTVVAQRMEKDFEPDAGAFDKVIAQERAESYKHGGRTVFGKAKPPADQDQLKLF